MKQCYVFLVTMVILIFCSTGMLGEPCVDKNGEISSFGEPLSLRLYYYVCPSIKVTNDYERIENFDLFWENARDLVNTEFVKVLRKDFFDLPDKDEAKSFRYQKIYEKLPSKFNHLPDVRLISEDKNLLGWKNEKWISRFATETADVSPVSFQKVDEYKALKRNDLWRMLDASKSTSDNKTIFRLLFENADDKEKNRIYTALFKKADQALWDGVYFEYLSLYLDLSKDVKKVREIVGQRNCPDYGRFALKFAKITGSYDQEVEAVKRLIRKFEKKGFYKTGCGISNLRNSMLCFLKEHNDLTDENRAILIKWLVENQSYGDIDTQNYPVLIKQLKSHDENLRVITLCYILDNLALKNIPEKEYTTLVIALLRNQNKREIKKRSERVIEWLGKIVNKETDKAANRFLFEKLMEAENPQKSPALMALGRKATKMIPAILDLWDQDDPLSQTTVFDILGYMGPGAVEAIPFVKSKLCDSDWTIRVGALKTLGEIGGAAKTCVPDIRKLLHDRNKGVREAAVVAIVLIDELDKTRRIREQYLK